MEACSSGVTDILAFGLETIKSGRRKSTDGIDLLLREMWDRSLDRIIDILLLLRLRRTLEPRKCERREGQESIDLCWCQSIIRLPFCVIHVRVVLAFGLEAIKGRGRKCIESSDLCWGNAFVILIFLSDVGVDSCLRCWTHRDILAFGLGGVD